MPFLQLVFNSIASLTLIAASDFDLYLHHVCGYWVQVTFVLAVLVVVFGLVSILLSLPRGEHSTWSNIANISLCLAIISCVSSVASWLFVANGLSSSGVSIGVSLFLQVWAAMLYLASGIAVVASRHRTRRRRSDPNKDSNTIQSVTSPLQHVI
ncbi:hypothetical protein AC1031_000679 [Aphanomyces cochlioides]|nr:hypothetical protein AC1031_000679 [Aphanomyces cochlioides]